MPYSRFNDVPVDIRDRAAKVRLAIFDVDGVLTDGRLTFSDDGRELKSFHVHDGLGLKRLMANAIEVAIITARMSHVVAQRTAQLGIAHVYQGQEDKLGCFEHLIHALKLEPDQCSYCGDDLPDLAVMKRVGLSIAVANAHPWIHEHAHWRTRQVGGDGAVREVSDLLLLAQGKGQSELDRFG
ncbi:MAG TPA: 3-deoxy-manno-octulosonate-8-phosphatase KdsC [Rudaea sp.]|nr:3-deoxy-manno-octulosonate-8-phosphatase KdsC [Rudaea sp.]